ncbi:MAG: hypothetical protein ACLTBS_05090 [Eisenbergiella sp.]
MDKLTKARQYEQNQRMDASKNEYGKMWECPDFFTLNGRQILVGWLQNWDNYLHWGFMGSFSDALKDMAEYLTSGSRGGRNQRVPDARLNLLAECLKCNGKDIKFVAKAISGSFYRVIYRVNRIRFIDTIDTI